MYKEKSFDLNCAYPNTVKENTVLSIQKSGSNMFEAIHFCALDKQLNVSSSVNLSQKRFIYSHLQWLGIFLTFVYPKKIRIITFKTIIIRYESIEHRLALWLKNSDFSGS